MRRYAHQADFYRYQILSCQRMRLYVDAPVHMYKRTSGKTGGIDMDWYPKSVAQIPSKRCSWDTGEPQLHRLTWNKKTLRDPAKLEKHCLVSDMIRLHTVIYCNYIPSSKKNVSASSLKKTYGIPAPTTGPRLDRTPFSDGTNEYYSNCIDIYVYT